MSSFASSSPAEGVVPLAAWARRAALLGLLGAALLVPHLGSDGFDFPAVSDFWSLLPFGALFLLPFLDLRSPRRLLPVDLLVLLSLAVALGCLRNARSWPVLLVYPPLVYLCVRMVCLARVGRGPRPSWRSAPSRSLLGRSWLVLGIVVLVVVNASWALEGRVSTDVAEGGVRGALNVAHGRPLYERPASARGADPHTDTYGPFNYEAYLPFALVADGHLAARLTTLFFNLLTALLLFVLGRRIRGPTAGALLAYCWLAYPFTLYEDALGFNDSIVAAALVATVLAARSPARRGAMAAVAAWSKLAPLALLPLLASQPGAGRGARHDSIRFLAVFGLVTALIFAPALAHSSVGVFMSRTFGFQAQRAPSGSIWAVLIGPYAAHAAWIGTASRIAHGLLVALTGAFALSLLRAPRREDLVGLAACVAAVLIAIELCLSYYAFSYILWFAPLVLIAVILERLPAETRALPATV